MDRKDVKEFHFITPIANVPSIMKHGILSHRLSAKLPHDSVAMHEVQDRRRNKKIPGTGKYIHDYANLYFDAHNPMLSKRREKNSQICVLRVDANVLDLSGAIIADRNAASDWARFYPVQEGLAAIDKDLLFAVYWTNHDNEYEVMKHKSIKCAEVLIPGKIGPEYVLGAYVASDVALAAFRKLENRLTVELKGGIFF